jgi:hypothetical protein
MTALGVCEVCYLLDGDTTVKQVEYCSLCDAWMCEQCRNNYLRRMKAMIVRRMVGGRGGKENNLPSPSYSIPSGN